MATICSRYPVPCYFHYSDPQIETLPRVPPIFNIVLYHIGTHFFPSPRVACHCDHVLIYPRAACMASFLYSAFAQLGKLPFTLLWFWLPTTRGHTWVVLSGSMFLLSTLSNLPPPYGSHRPLPKGNAQSMPSYNIFFHMARSTPAGLSNDVLPISMLNNFFWVSHSIPMKIADLGLTSLSHSTIFSIGSLFYTCNKCQTYG